jgi:hypothetical protein
MHAARPGKRPGFIMDETTMSTKETNQFQGAEFQKNSIAKPEPQSESPWDFQLPRIPITTSPVPWLTSIHARPGRGAYGDPGYRGNCSGLLIEDLLRFFRPTSVFDPMTGSGTCRDVCSALGISCASFDLHSGFDATTKEGYAGLGPFDFVWLHPPYWQMIRYGSDPRCLSNAPTLGEFLDRLQAVIRNCVGILSPRGKLAVLMGDYKHNGEYLALPFRTMGLAHREGLRLACPEIIRCQHGATSSSKAYSTSFIPRLHDVCLVLEKSRCNARKNP